MPLKREYFPSDTIKLINKSEHKLVRGGVRGTAATLGAEDKHAAHSIGRHLLAKSPGARGLGISLDAFRDRFLDAPDNLSSAWAGKGEMAVLLCELLNSDVGQLALEKMDAGVDRVVVHYLNMGKLAGLFGGLVGTTKFKESAVTVTPASEVLAMVPVMNTKTNQPVMVKGVAKMIQQKTILPRSVSANIKAKDIASVNTVLDRYAKGLHVQTLYPSSEATASFIEYRLGVVTFVMAYDGSGTLLTKMTGAA